MDDGSKPPLVALIILLGFSAFWALAETALASVSRNKIKSAADHGDSRAKHVLYAIDNFDKAITTILICNNITSVAIATIVTVFVTGKWGVSFVSLSTVITTLVIFFACEMLPKTLAKKNSFKISLFCTGLITFLMKILSPISFILTYIGEVAAKHTKDETDEVSVTEDELQDIIEDMAEEGTLDEQQSDLISSALQFGDTTVKKILTPRMDITAIDVDDTPEEIFNFIKNQTHSRIPVYEESIDNIIGILRIRKYFNEYVKTKKKPNIKRLIDKVYFAHANTEISELLPLMSEHKTNIAIIKDEYGGTLGLITVEDILEELVGDIWDESDVIEEDMHEADKTEYIDSEVVKEGNE